MPVAVAPDPRAVDDATIMQRVRAGLTYVEVGLRLGISPNIVRRVAKDHGYDARQRIRLTARMRAAKRQQRAFTRAREEAEKARLDPLCGKGVPPPRNVRVPEWIRRADLADDYRDMARTFDEFAAARHCRTLKAEAEAGDGGRG